MEHPITEVTSILVSIDNIIHSKNRYNIPRYQRLYVWENEQVETLLQDLHTAFVSKKSLFYLGGIITVKHDGHDPIFDLIDGQQRFTTLWLLSTSLGNSLTDFATVDGELRVKFSIREDAKAYFERFLNIGTEPIQIKEFSSSDSLNKVDNARNRINVFIEQRFRNVPEELIKFSAFIRNSVKLIITEVPHDTDLNKMFEVINNRGQQLQQHEILKASLLSKIENKQERVRYGKLWNACADMNTYVERSMQTEAGKNLADVYSETNRTFGAKDVLETLKGNWTRVTKSMSLNDILQGKRVEFDEDEELDTKNEIEEHPEAKDDESQEIRSILSFPQLLLHTLRIFLFENERDDIQRIDEKELLDIFRTHLDQPDERKAKSFITTLFDVRFAFDIFIIKWVATGPREEVHLIKALNKYRVHGKRKHFLQRNTPETYDGFMMLQSMLYHSQQITTQYWLTPLLHKCLYTRDRDELFLYLKQLDNVLFCTNKLNTLAERTWEAMQTDIAIDKESYNCDELLESAGVSFPHYWFYKTEFILWEWFMQSKDRKPNVREQLWKDFRMTAKNSVEHISPQTPRSYDQFAIQKGLLNDFGNLVLVSRSINSEASNNIYTTKRSEFLAKPKLDSLKSDLIYANATWSDDLCNQHRDKMIEYFVDYFANN